MVPRRLFAFRIHDSLVAVRPAWLAGTIICVILTFVPLMRGPWVDDSNSFGFVLASWCIIVAVLSILLHVSAHAYAAQRLNNPPSHLQLIPLGDIEDGYNRPGTPFSQTLTALAGPAANLALGLLFALLWLAVPSSSPALRNAVAIAAIGNGLLVTSNLIPAYPLDGGRVFQALFWYLHDDYKSGTRLAMSLSQLLTMMSVGVGLVLLSVRSDWSPVGLWLVVIGWGLGRAARVQFSRVHLLAEGSQRQLGELVQGLNPRITVDATLDDAIELLLAEQHPVPALVRANNTIVGVIGLPQIREVRRADWAHVAVSHAMLAIDDLPDIAASATIEDLLIHVPDTNSPFWVVTDGQEIVAVIDTTSAMTRLVERIQADASLRRSQSKTRPEN